MKARPCVECGRPFTPPVRGGRPPTRCPDCRDEVPRVAWPPSPVPVFNERRETRQRTAQTAMQRLLAEAQANEWMRDGNCVGVDPELFYPVRGASTSEAKAVCHVCSVRAECLEYALGSGERFGVWGGLSERERRRLRSQRARDRRGLVA